MSDDPDVYDAIDCALNVEALRKAAREGERAAAALLFYADASSAAAKGLEYLKSLMKRDVVASPSGFDDPRVLRAMAAQAMSLAALDAPSGRMRRTAQAYLAKTDP